MGQSNNAHYLSEAELAELVRCVVGDAETDDWQRFLEFTVEMNIEPGTVVIQQNDRDRDVFILTSGELEIRTAPSPDDAELVIAKISPFAVFGEQSFLDGGVRTATVAAAKPSRVHRLTSEAFERMCAQAPDLSCALLYDIARSLSLRERVSQAASDT